MATKKKSDVLAAADAFVAYLQVRTKYEESMYTLRKQAEVTFDQDEDAFYPILFATSDPNVVVQVHGCDPGDEIRVSWVVRE